MSLHQWGDPDTERRLTLAEWLARDDEGPWPLAITVALFVAMALVLLHAWLVGAGVMQP